MPIPFFRGFRNARGPAARLFVPSLFLCGLVAGSIVTAVGGIAGRSMLVTGVCLVMTAGAALPFIYRNSMAAREGSFFASGNAARLGMLLLLGVALSAVSFFRVGSLLGPPDPLPRGREWIAEVESVKLKRYHVEAVARFAPAPPRGATRSPEIPRRRGLLRCRVDSGIGPGDVVRFSARPREIASSGDRGRALRMRGIGHALYLEDAPIIFLERGGSFRETMRKRIAENCDRLFGKDSSSAAKALYFGNQEFIDKVTLADFKRAGVLHVLAASGLHVAVVAALPVFLLGLVRLPKKMILAVTGLLVLGYLWITDMPVSLIRACAMFLLFGMQRILDRKANVFNALFLSALLIMMLFPEDLFSLGFQLSYGATLGILLFHSPYRRALEGLPGPLAGPLSVSLAAQTTVVPLILHRMNEINLAGPLANLAVIPVISLFLVASIAANLLSLVTSAASWLGLAGDFLYAAARMIAGVFSGLGLHRAGGEAWKALPVVLFCLAAPLALRRFLTPPLLLALPAAVVTAWLLIPGPWNARRHATVFRHENGALLLAREGSALTIIGVPPGRRHLGRVAEEAAAAQCREVVLRARRGDFTTLTGFEYLARRLPVRRCHLPGDFRIRGYTERFFSLLERDRAELVLEGPDGAARADGMTVPSTWAGRLYGRISGPGPAAEWHETDGDSGEIRNVTLR